MILKIKLNENDRKKVISLKFSVPEKCKKITINKKILSSINNGFKNKIDISFFDSDNKWYGRFDRYKASFEISDKNSTIGVVSSGIWKANFEVFQIYEEIEIELDIQFEIYNNYNIYKGELHTHTNITDGKLDFSDLVEYIKKNEYDFFFISDHNSITAWDQIKNLKKINCYKGLELTTFYGHILLLGVDRYVDWYKKNGALKKIKSIKREVESMNGLMGIAHPFTCGGPFCAGCRWEKSIDPEHFNFIEVWNSKAESYKNNWEAIDAWVEFLKKGIEIFCTCGGDIHRYGDLEVASKIHSLACQNKESMILDSLRAGRFYLSKKSLVTLDINGKTFGEKLYSYSENIVKYKISDPADDLQLFIISKEGMKKLDHQNKEIIWNTENKKDFFVLMGINSQRQLEFLTNPIFIEKRQKT